MGVPREAGRGVSPIIGVALMVMIVILLAASMMVMFLSFSEELPESTEFFVEEHCPGFHIAEYEAGKFQEFANMLQENNCALWLKHGEVTSDGSGNVGRWGDLGPHGFDAVQSESARRPGLSGNHVIFEADHTGDPENNMGNYLTVKRNVDSLDLEENAGIAVAAVIKTNHFDRNGVWTIGEAGVAPGSEFSLRTCSDRSIDGCEFENPEGWWRAQHWDEADVDFQSGNASAGEWMTIIHGYDGDEIFIRVNGEEVERETAELDLSENRDIQLGRWDRQGEYWYFDGEIAEVLIFDQALTPDEIELLESYLESAHDDVSLDGPIDEEGF